MLFEPIIMQYIIGVFLSFFLVILILTKKSRNLSDIYLAVWIAIIGMQIFGYYTFISGLIYVYPKLMWLNFPYEFLHGPLLYLFVKSLTNPEHFRSKKWLFHFILPILILFTTFPIMALPDSQRILFYKNNGKGFEEYFFDWALLMVILGIVYNIITIGLLLNHKKRIRNQFSYQENINLNWLWFLIFGMSITWTIIMLGGSDKWIFSTSSFLLVFMGFFGIRQVGIFTDQPFQPQPVNELEADDHVKIEPVTEKKKYYKSSLKDDTARQLQETLRQLMQQKKLYAIPDLSLTDLATQLDIHPNYLSQVINDLEGVNFYNYINTLRVQEFLKLVAEPENRKYTLLSLAYDCGFNSKTTFNRFFKKATGLSPSEYLNGLPEIS